MLANIKDTFQRTAPEQQGIASGAVLGLVEALEHHMRDIHSFMLLRHGAVIAEGWWSPYQREYPHMLFSLSKSFTSTAIGLAVAEERLAVTDTVLSFFADEAPTNPNAELAAMTVYDLLTMTTGHAQDTWTPMMERADGNWINAFFTEPVKHQPGTHFLYNTGATFMLSAIVQRVTGMTMLEYLKPRLFEPLGIANPNWDMSPQGITVGGIGLHITTEDIARFGQLYLQKGVWNGKQLIPEAWVTAATSFQVSNGTHPESDWAQGYGYQFWRCRHNIYRGDGAFGQYCIVIPEHDVVIAITSGLDVLDMQEPLDIIWEHLLPALQTEALPEDAPAHDRLLTKMAQLAIAPIVGDADTPQATSIVGKPYHFAPNTLKLESLTLHPTAIGWTLNLTIAGNTEMLACGYGTWQTGHTKLFNPTTSERVAISGAWTAPDTLTLVLRFVETTFYDTLVCTFAADELLIETRVNVSFGAPENHLLTAKRG